MASVSYTPLSSETCIRLFELEPSPIVNASLRGILREVELSKAENKYEALSYVWGSERCSIALSCNGRSFPVLQNLDEALRYLRDRHQVRRLWIDYICINQGDKAERSQQVQQMGKIFHYASRALIWLGKGSKSTAPALECLEWLHARYNLSRNQTAKNYMKLKRDIEGKIASSRFVLRLAYLILQPDQRPKSTTIFLHYVLIRGMEEYGPCRSYYFRNQV